MTITAPVDGDPIDPQWAQDITDAVNAQLTADWASYTPTVTNLTQGSGTITARYMVLGDNTLSLRFKFVFGSGSAVGTDPQFSLPPGLTLASSYAASELVCMANLLDSGTATRRGGVAVISGLAALRFVQFTAGSDVLASITATSPWTWTTNDSMSCVIAGLELA